VSAGTSGSPIIGSPPVGIYTYREWSGDDGRYESYNGYQRSKWNSYQLSHRAARVSGKLSYRCPSGHNYDIALQSLPPWGTCGFPHISDAQNLNRLSKLLAKIKGHSFNAAVTVSQAGQLASMVTSNLSKLGRSVMALKHGDFAGAARCLGASPRPSKLKANDIGGRWLELQYGWLPSLSDTYEAAKAYESISNGPAKSRFSAKEEHKSTKTYLSSTINGDRMVAKGTYSRTYTFEMYEELGFSRQLGLVDPLSVLWENIPYSFVVDWFLPIGDYLSVLNQIPELKGRWMITDYAAWTVSSYEPSSFMPFCPVHAGQQFTSVVSRPTVYYAEEHASRDTSGPTVNFPNAKLFGAVHGRRVANAIALAAGRFLR
jgi:hypothetical protein